MSMVTLRLNNIDPSYNLDWIYTNWEVSTAKNFDRSQIVVSSYEDRVNKQAIFFEVELNPGRKYYARAQIVTNKGAHKWTNLNVWTHKGYSDIDNTRDMPSVISSPHPYTDSNPNNHVPTGFTIKCRDFGCIGDAVHTATSYWIEDIEGNVVWKNLRNTVFLNSILVDDVILDDGKIYRAKAMFHSSSDDTSPIATYTFSVGGVTKDGNISKISAVVSKKTAMSNTDAVVHLFPKEGALKIHVRITGYRDQSAFIAMDKEADLTVGDPIITIPRGTVREKEVYIVLCKYDNEDKWCHVIANTY